MVKRSQKIHFKLKWSISLSRAMVHKNKQTNQSATKYCKETYFHLFFIVGRLFIYIACICSVKYLCSLIHTTLHGSILVISTIPEGIE